MKGKEAPKFWSWEDVHEIAGIAGVEPWGYSLRDLLTRAKAVQLEEWDKIAAIRAQIFSFHAALSGKRVNIKIEDFNPHRKAGSSTSSGGSGNQFAGQTPLKKMSEIAKAGAYLPKKLTEEQKAAIWDRLMDVRVSEKARKDAIVQMRSEARDG